MKKRIFLYGIQGIYNYGCEAMVRAISDTIYESDNNSEISYMSYNYEYDNKHLADCKTVTVKPLDVHVKSKKLSHKLKRAIKYLKKRINIASPEDYLPYDTMWLHKCDVLIIIGGDVFDLLPGQETGYNNERIWASKVVKNCGGKVYLWGISLGDIECNSVAKKSIIDYFANIVDRSAIRDSKSNEYLQTNGIVNSKVYADPAYMIKTEQTDLTKKENKVLGINLSPLANRYAGVNKNEGEWIEFWANFIKSVVRELKYDNVILIPHVCKDDKSDDDFSYLQKILNTLKRDRIDAELVPKNIGFLRVKEYIVKCNLLISARMHCSINAITCGVPTVFLSYSPKSVGMCEFVYGNDDYVIDINGLVRGDVNIETFKMIGKKEDEIRTYLQRRSAELAADAKSAYSYLFN